MRKNELSNGHTGHERGTKLIVFLVLTLSLIFPFLCEQVHKNIIDKEAVKSSMKLHGFQNDYPNSVEEFI